MWPAEREHGQNTGGQMESISTPSKLHAVLFRATNDGEARESEQGPRASVRYVTESPRLA